MTAPAIGWPRARNQCLYSLPPPRQRSRAGTFTPPRIQYATPSPDAASAFRFDIRSAIERNQCLCYLCDRTPCCSLRFSPRLCASAVKVTGRHLYTRLKFGYVTPEAALARRSDPRTSVVERSNGSSPETNQVGILLGRVHETTPRLAVPCARTALSRSPGCDRARPHPDRDGARSKPRDRSARRPWYSASRAAPANRGRTVPPQSGTPMARYGASRAHARNRQTSTPALRRPALRRSRPGAGCSSSQSSASGWSKLTFLRSSSGISSMPR